MPRSSCLPFIVALIIGLALAGARQGATTIPTAGTAAYFSPAGGCTGAIVRELDAARHQVRAQAYSFTSAPIAKALTDAKARGVDSSTKANDPRKDLITHS